MTEENRVQKIYSAFFRQEFPLDLTLVVVWLSATIIVIYLPLLNTNLIRIVLALPTILFIPGYCLIAVLFPKKRDIGFIERIMLSIGCSIAVVPLIGLGLNFTPWGIRLDPLVIALIFFTWLMVLAAHYQRAMLPSEERFRVPFFTMPGRIHQVLLPHEEVRVDRLLSIVLITVMFVAIITTIYVIVVPKNGELFSEFYILGSNQTASDYPEVITTGLRYPMYIGVGNQEQRKVNYTVETWMVESEFHNVTNTSSIVLMDPGDRISLTLAHNETKIIPYTISVNSTDYDQVEFLLFNESVPGPEVIGRDRIDASYREVHLWISINAVEYQEPSEDRIVENTTEISQDEYQEPPDEVVIEDTEVISED